MPPTLIPKTRTHCDPFYVTADRPAMIGGPIEAGDLLLVHPGLPVSDGVYVLYETAGGRFVARVRKHEEALHLTPVSPTLSPLVFTQGAPFPMYRILMVSKSV